MTSKEHWEKVYTKKAVSEVSWFQVSSGLSLKLICKVARSKSVAIIDVGGGASVLVDELLASGYQNLTVIDLSNSAMEAVRERLKERASSVDWLQDDILSYPFAESSYDIWHDRAVFHFFNCDKERELYLAQAKKALKPNGKLVISTFAEDGPVQCSGLAVTRYSVKKLSETVKNGFQLVEHYREIHTTPWQSEQTFIYCVFQLIEPVSPS
ncbi:class I SAM-dependent methyltransferase [Aliikangiella sp. G2MR2-5]|uniref:class I SAM-dependent methyltransferase n=1 Tax=Aliikangiella sp. G2MR2-5 TaxID=2788943 RepID=UPI0018A89475|nr:class I SAM-dependent methyltransferase [Aliikangiella sp. G2MR2-5]